jgi:hypothetical protein
MEPKRTFKLPVEVVTVTSKDSRNKKRQLVKTYQMPLSLLCFLLSDPKAQKPGFPL